MKRKKKLSQTSEPEEVNYNDPELEEGECAWPLRSRKS